MYRLTKKDFEYEWTCFERQNWRDPSLLLESMKARAEALELAGELLILVEQKGFEMAKATYEMERLCCHCMMSRALIEAYHIDLRQQKECWKKSVDNFNATLEALPTRQLDTDDQTL